METKWKFIFIFLCWAFAIDISTTLFVGVTDWENDDSFDKYEIGDLSSKFGTLNDESTFKGQVSRYSISKANELVI